jgi:hypothetical protein
VPEFRLGQRAPPKVAMHPEPALALPPVAARQVWRAPQASPMARLAAGSPQAASLPDDRRAVLQPPGQRVE